MSSAGYFGFAAFNLTLAITSLAHASYTAAAIFIGLTTYNFFKGLTETLKQ